MRSAFVLTHLETVDDQLAEVPRAKTAAERVELIFAANRTARLLATAGARYLHPDWSESQIQFEVARRVSSGAVGITETSNPDS